MIRDTGKRVKIDGEELAIMEGEYVHSKRLAIELWSLEDGRPFTPYARLTVNFEDAKLEPGEFLVKTWSENRDVCRQLLDTAVFLDTGKRVQISAYVNAAVWRYA